MRNFFARSVMVFGLGASLVGCAANNSPDGATSTSLQKALSIGCPVVATLQQSKASFSNAQLSALNALALVCPPNGAPTAATVAIADVLDAYAILRPLIK
jgi:hypothetical protein